MDLTTIHQGVHKAKRKKRVGRGIGSGHGKTASRGHKGQYASAGAEMFSSLFEGGQTPLYRRSPKRGFSNGTFREPTIIINVGDLNAEDKVTAGSTVSLKSLKEAKVLRGAPDILRVLGDGELTKALTVEANHFTKSAREKIEKAGGTVVEVAGPKPPVRNKMKPRKPKV